MTAVIFADRTVTATQYIRSAFGTIMSSSVLLSVCLSVRPSVTLRIVALRVRVEG